MAGFRVVPSRRASVSGSAWSSMPPPIQLPPPQSYEVCGGGIPVELALDSRRGNEARDPSLQVKDGLHVQREAQLFQLALHLRHGLTLYRYLTTPDNLSRVDPGIDQLDRDAGSLL